MNDIVPYLLQAIGGLLALLLMILSWSGKRIHKQLDEIQSALSHSEKETHEMVTQLDMRVTRIETKCTLTHAHQPGGMHL